MINSIPPTTSRIPLARLAAASDARSVPSPPTVNGSGVAAPGGGGGAGVL
jgi:hypothetical protein